MQYVIPLTLGAAMLTTPVVLAQEYGDLAVKFVVQGNVPPPAKLSVDKHQKECAKHELLDESIVVSKDGGLANVVVYTSRGEELPENPALKKEMPAEVVLDYRNCRFSPRIVVVTTDQVLKISNSDPVGHNSVANLSRNSPFNHLIPAKGEITETFAKAERAPEYIVCNIHTWMRAYLVVRDNPYTGVSDETGNLTIKGIPVGEWSFTVWHETGYVQGQQKGKSLGWKRGKVSVKIESGKETDLGTIEVPAESLLK
jgi:hypothetical protein